MQHDDRYYHTIFMLADDKRTVLRVEANEEGTVQWGRWMEDFTKRLVARTDVGDLWVSTVFLGRDASLGLGKPRLWESAIFDAEGNRAVADYGEYHATYDEAVAGHEVAVLVAQAMDAAFK